MRGGAIPAAAWGTLLVALLTLNWIWTGDAIQVGTFGFAALAILSLAAGLIRAAPEARHRGAPEPRLEPEPIPQMSLGALMAGLAVASIVLGLAFGHFAIYFGVGLLALALGRIALELRAQRRWRNR